MAANRHASHRRIGLGGRASRTPAWDSCTAKVTAKGLTGGDIERQCLTLTIAFFPVGKPFLACGDTGRQAWPHGSHP